MKALSKSLALLIALVLLGVAPEARGEYKVERLDFKSTAHGLAIIVRSNRSPSFTSFKLTDPFRIVFDMADGRLDGIPEVISDGLPKPLSEIRTSQHDVDGIPVARLVFSLSKATKFQSAAQGGKLIILLEGIRGEAPAGVGGNQPASADVAAVKMGKDDKNGEGADSEEGFGGELAANTGVDMPVSDTEKFVTWIGFLQMDDHSRVFVRTNEPVTYRLQEGGGNSVVLELYNTRLGHPNNRRFLDTRFFSSAVRLITPEEIEGPSPMVRVQIELKDKVPFETGQKDRVVAVDFKQAAAGASP